MAEHNTTFEVSSMTQLDNNSNVKALAIRHACNERVLRSCFSLTYHGNSTH